MTLPVKVGGGALTLVTISGLSGVGSAYMNDKKIVSNTQQGTAISKIIEDQFDYILLRTEVQEDNAHWSTNWSNYKNDNQDKGPKEDTFKLDGWVEGNKTSLNLVDQLKAKCSNLSISIVYDGGKALYDDVTKYCAREVTIADEVDKLQLKIVSVEGSGGGNDYSIWTQRARKRNDLQGELATLNITETDNAYKILEGCKNVTKTKKKGNTEYAKILDAYKKVCTR